MAIEVWNGISWQDVDDPEIYNGSSWLNVQRGEIWTGSGWETFYIRSVGNGGTAAAPVIALSDKSSRRIRITVSHTNTTGDKVIVVAYADNTSPPSILSPVETEIHPDTGYTTTTYSGQIETFGSNTYNSILDKNTTYYIGSVAMFYNNSGGLIKSVPGNTLTITTHPYYTAGQPVNLEDYRTTTSISLLTTGNAYNNGTAWIQWQYQRRVASPVGAWADVGTVNASSDVLTDNETAEFKAYNFESLSSTYEYRFRARVVYSGLGNSNSEVGPWSAYSDAIRPKRYVATQSGSNPLNNTTYFTSASTGSASSTTGSYTYDLASDGNNNTAWISSGTGTTTTAAIAVDNISRDGSYTYFEKIGGYDLLSVTEAKVTDSSTLTYAALFRYTYAVSPERWTAITASTANDAFVYPFYTGDSVNIQDADVGGINGTRTVVQRKSSDNLAFVTNAAAITNAWTIDSISLRGSTINGNPVSNLNTPYATFRTAEFVSGSTSTVRIANSLLVGSAPSFSEGSSDANIYLTGTYAKGSGEESLAYYFVPTKTNARMISGTNSVRVKNGVNACSITVYLNGTDLGTQSFSGDEEKYFSIPSGTKYPDQGPSNDAFSVSVFATRVDTGFGWLSSVKEVQVNYTYDELV